MTPHSNARTKEYFKFEKNANSPSRVHSEFHNDNRNSIQIFQ